LTFDKLKTVRVWGREPSGATSPRDADNWAWICRTTVLVADLVVFEHLRDFTPEEDGSCGQEDRKSQDRSWLEQHSVPASVQDGLNLRIWDIRVKRAGRECRDHEDQGERERQTESPGDHPASDLLDRHLDLLP